MVGLQTKLREGREVVALVTTRGTFFRSATGWEQLHGEGQRGEHWSRGCDGRFVRAAAVYSGVLSDYSKLMGRA